MAREIPTQERGRARSPSAPHGEGARPHAPQTGRAVAPRPPQLVRLGDVCEIVSGSTPKTSVESYWGGSFPWITPAELNDKTVVVGDTARHLSEEGVASAALKPFPAGTVLLSSRAPIGKVAIAGCDMYCNQGFKNLICSDAIHNFYLYYWLKSHTAFLNSLGRGATFKEISKAIVAQIQIPLPPLPEQKRIAAILDKICEMKRNAEARLQKLDLLVKARFVEMFGDGEAGTAKYPVLRLEDVCSSLSAGKDVPEDHTKEPDATHVIPIFSNGIERSGLYGYASVARITEPSITISGRGTIGWVCRRMTPFVPIIRLIVATPKLDVVDIVYLESALRGRCAVNTGTTIPQLPVPTAKNIKVILPPLALQRQFAAFVEKVEGLKATAKKELEQVDLLYRAKLQEFFG